MSNAVALLAEVVQITAAHGQHFVAALQTDPASHWPAPRRSCVSIDLETILKRNIDLGAAIGGISIPMQLVSLGTSAVNTYLR